MSLEHPKTNFLIPLLLFISLKTTNVVLDYDFLHMYEVKNDKKHSWSPKSIHMNKYSVGNKYKLSIAYKCDLLWFITYFCINIVITILGVRGYENKGIYDLLIIITGDLERSLGETINYTN